MKRALLLIAAFAISAAAQTPQGTSQSSGPQIGAEIIRFRGAYLGQAVTDFVDCSSGKAKPIDKGFKSHGDVCHGKRGQIWHTKVRGTMLPRAEGEAFNIDHGAITKIEIYFADEDWEKLRYDLTQKLGEPKSEAPDVYQNLFGAHWEFQKGYWRKGDVVAIAGMNVETFGGCHFSDIFDSGSRYRPCAKGMKIVITTAQLAGAPDSRPNTLE